MAWPLGAIGAFYTELTRRLGQAPTQQQYNAAIREANALWGTNLPEYTDTAAPPAPPIAPPLELPGPVTTPGGGPADIGAPGWYDYEEQMRLQAQEDAAAMQRLMAQLAATSATSADQIAAQLEIQRMANEAGLERTRGTVAGSLAQALMTHNIAQGQLTMDVARLGADPRSTVGFLGYLGQAGGGATAISQNIAAGIEPSPVWEYMPETQGIPDYLQEWISWLREFLGGMGQPLPGG